MPTMAAPLPFLPEAAGSGWLALPEAPALTDGGGDWLSYAALAATIAALQPALATKRKSLIFCCLNTVIGDVAAYLAALASGHAVAVLDPKLPQLAALIATYQPDFIIGHQPPAASYQPVAWPDMPQVACSLWQRRQPSPHPIHPDLCLLLLTSGSTGGGKFVRLSYHNLASNTAAIIHSLTLKPTARALLHLPLSYSFGLSVLHTQLAVGGSVVLTQLGLLDKGFWELARTSAATLLPGVPYHYTMLAKLGLGRLNAPQLKIFLQAGGRLDPMLATSLCREITARHGEFYIMYGQTEAAPRLSCLAAHRQPDKIGSVGTALTGGRFEILADEIIYHGANVMLGYCTEPADLAAGDTQHGRLATGDIGTLDADGFLTISGRSRRLAKLYGVRLALDEIEQIANRFAPAMALVHDERLVLATTAPDAATHATIKAALLAATTLQPAWISLVPLAQLPYHANGKPDYSQLQALLPPRAG
jgi:acyl-CoA synthetase (AMP-forming)/AMP-acid ligase II